MPSSLEKKLQSWGANVAEQIVRAAIRGAGPMKGAVEVTEEHLAQYADDREEAVQRLIAPHVRMAAGSGFLTGLGGVVTLPVTIPAALAGLYVFGARTSAGIAHLRGYDVESEDVRSAVLISLLGSGRTEILRGLRCGVSPGCSCVRGSDDRDR
ncbi:hypothetical protein ACQEVB_39625 [Pseudonocardia sp. CA-107938]|uniref:hypothetical protein n=1 Tax=Pseudonocardia sp. CA-107938 TaxID=3240021 RepID=UPI003D902D94